MLTGDLVEFDLRETFTLDYRHNNFSGYNPEIVLGIYCGRVRNRMNDAIFVLFGDKMLITYRFINS